MPNDDPSSAEPAALNGHARRSAHTRAKLIDATIACLYRSGYAATTTIAVAKEARVSRGAMLHQFATRADLLIATAEHIVRTQDDYRRSKVLQQPRGEERFNAITEVVWETMQQPASLALIEVMLGSRSDPDLRDRFPAVMRDVENKMMSGPVEIAIDMGIVDDELVRSMTRLHMAAMRGLVIERLFEPGRDIDRSFDLLRWYKTMVVERMKHEAEPK